MMDEHQQHIQSWYASLCAISRQMEKNKPDAACIFCPRKFSEHDNDGRCTVFVCTTHYRAVNQDEIERTSAIIASLESLAATAGWSLI